MIVLQFFGFIFSLKSVSLHKNSGNKTKEKTNVQLSTKNPELRCRRTTGLLGVHNGGGEGGPHRAPRLLVGAAREAAAGGLCQPLHDDSIEQVGFLQGLALICQLFVRKGGHEDKAGGSHGWPGVHNEESDIADPAVGCTEQW